MLKRKRRSSRSKSKSRIWSSATLVSALLLVTFPVGAQEKDDASGSDICIADAICRAHYSRARKLSKKDDYEGALEAYEAAYRRKPAQWLLINMGRTLHKLGRTQDAIDQYQRYLASSDANVDLRKKAEQFLHEAEADLASRPKKEPPKSGSPDAAGTVPGNLPPAGSTGNPDKPGPDSQTPPPKREDKTPALNPIVVEPVAPASYKEPPPSRLGPLFYGGLAVSGALIVGGIITGSIGLSSAKTLQATPYAGSLNASTLPELQKRVQSLGYATDVMIPLGVATVAVTTIVSLVRKPASEKSATAATPGARSVAPNSAVGTAAEPSSVTEKPAPAASSPSGPAAADRPAPESNPGVSGSTAPASTTAPSPAPSPIPNPIPNPTPNPTP